MPRPGEYSTRLEQEAPRALADLRDSLDQKERERLTHRGITVEEAARQLARLRAGFAPVKLERPCTVGDGIFRVPEERWASLIERVDRATASGRVSKFVPASGAASRMFKEIVAARRGAGEAVGQIDRDTVKQWKESGSDDQKSLATFLEELPRFAFFEHLKERMEQEGRDAEQLHADGVYGPLLAFVLDRSGLDLSNLPKGLIPFHRYPEEVRSPMEEHLAESPAYCRAADGSVRVHFTVSPQHQPLFAQHLSACLTRVKAIPARFEVSFSAQSPATDTLAATGDGKSWRDEYGRLVFRPGGHGALLENLNDLDGDLVFVRNIDNVVPDSRKEDNCRYEKLLGGVLLETEEQIHGYLHEIEQGPVGVERRREMQSFAETVLCVRRSTTTGGGPDVPADQESLRRWFQRPLRVCAMVKNEGEPGGGPFWVRHGDDSMSIQIVETAQVDLDNPRQREILSQSTHFNPVDMVCGLRDHRGEPYKLQEFVDPEMGIVTRKSHEGRDLLALELPGLWNGSMARWNTAFVEVPVSTFAPVKTVLDLLRDVHQ